MSRAARASDSARPLILPPPLEPGDRLDQKTFHERYEAMPQETRAELIGSVVFMPSPTKLPHARLQLKVSAWLNEYEVSTRSVQAAENATVIMGLDSELQPDCCLFILPDHGGRIHVNEHIEGTPELVVELASSTESYDLHSKMQVYEQAGVNEYLVVALRQQRVFWFSRDRQGRFREMPCGEDGVYRSRVFPGLWLNSRALLGLDDRAMREVLAQGLAGEEHAAFVRGLS